MNNFGLSNWIMLASATEVISANIIKNLKTKPKDIKTQCKTCGKMFYISSEYAQFLKKRNKQYPQECNKCKK